MRVPAIMARPGAQTLHPADKALLRPLTSLGKPNAASGAVSFLRRTEYTASQNTQHFSSSTSKDLLRMRNEKRRKPSMNKDDPINIMRNIVKGFDIAYPRDAYRGEDSTTNLRGAQVTDAELKAWSNPKHPSNPELKLLDSYPVLPDPEAIPTTGFYMIMKFHGNPLSKTETTYDKRLDTAILKPTGDEQSEMIFNEKMAAWEQSDKSKPMPIREYDYDYFLPGDESAVRNFKRKLNVNDPENDDPDLYTNDIADGQRGFRYKRIRRYETFSQQGDPKEFYNDTVALALHDPEMDASDGKQRLRKGAYFYPIVQRTGLRAKRNVGKMLYQIDEGKIDELNVTVADMSEESRAEQVQQQAQLDPAMRTGEVAG